MHANVKSIATLSILNDLELFPFIQAKNHLGNLLITALIENDTDQSKTIKNATIAYRIKDEIIAKHTFSFANLVIAPQTSIPWTFIFPKDTQRNQLLANKRQSLLSY